MMNSDADSDSDSGTAFQDPESHPIFDGDCNGVCSVDDFLAYMPGSESVKCREFPRELDDEAPPDFRVFWHPTGPNQPYRGFIHSAPLDLCYGGKPVSVQTRIMCLLLAMDYCDPSSMFMQFWTHSKSSTGQSILTVLEQPFRIGSMESGSLDIRVCKYRYGCMKQAIQVGDTFAGPVGRVFTRGSPEYSCKMDFYSGEDFPMRDYAKLSGRYMALPIFEQNKCVGVLEILTTECWNFHYFTNMKRLESIGLTTLSRIHSHPGDCHKTQGLQISKLYMDVLHFVRIEHKLPLIQLWIPCSCEENGSISRLFCRWTGRGAFSTSNNIYVKDERNLANGWHSVECGKGLVGKAYLQKKSCFLGDTSQFSISEYPLVHFTQSFGLTACFAIPLKSLDPRLHDVVLEVFLPPQQNSDHGNVGMQLQSFLSALVQNCQRSCVPRYNGPVPFKLKPSREFSVQYSHSDGDEFVYFDVSQKHRHVEDLENGREGHPFQPSRKTHDDQNRVMLSSDAESLSGDQVQNRETLGSSREKKHRRSSPDQTPATANNGDSNTHGIVQTSRKFADAAKKSKGRVPPLKRARENEAADANSVSTGANGKSIALVEDEINVMATYMDDTILFTLSRNSGIKELRMELDDAFQLGAEKFKVKYKHDDGTWITLLRDKDFRYHVEAVKVSGQSTVKLSVFPVSL